MQPVIELIGIYKAFDGVTVVNDVHIAIQKGEIVSLLGPSGCGKTTTLRMMAGFEAPTSGNILLNGKDILNKPARERNMGMVFQNYALFPHMTVFENIAFGLNVRHMPKREVKEKVDQMLSVVKLKGFEGRKPSQLSGGQQQRIALARALITEPEILLMDEPFGALDKKLREAMQLEIKNILKSLGITSVFVTHDQEEALVISDRVVVMSKGVIEQTATPKDIYERPETSFVADFIGISNEFSGTLQTGGAEGQSFVMTTPSGKKLTVQDAKVQDVGNACCYIIRPEKVRLFDVKPDEPNMFEGIVEDVKYLGTISQYYLNIGEERLLIVDCQNTANATPHQTGDKIYAATAPENLIRVRPSDGKEALR